MNLTNTRQCKKCLQYKEIMFFYKKKNKFSCIDCCRKQCQDYYKNNLEKIKQVGAIYRQNNKDKIKLGSLNYRKNNKEKARKCELICVQNRLKKDPTFHLSYKIRRLIRGYFNKKGVIKKSKTEDILGCSFDYFFSYLVCTALKNYGYWLDYIEYHIDHIIPISSAKNEQDVINLNHYSNLQLLLPIDNIIKSNKIIGINND